MIRGREATPEMLQKLLASAEMFHFSGHRVQRDDETALLLSGAQGVLNASSLRFVSMRTCRVAVLATCSSSVGAANDLDDTGTLTHALLIAGVGDVLGTLWDVDSRSSRELMLVFHRALRTSFAPAAALRKAQQSVSATPATSHPFFWAAMQDFTQ